MSLDDFDKNLDRTIISINQINHNYLKSLYKRKCLTRCYPKNVEYIHPLTLSIEKNNYNSCAVNLFTDEFGNTNYADKCNLEDNKTFKIPDEIESILLSFYFNPLDFLMNIYKISSFEQTIQWTKEHVHLPFITIKRVHNCSWKVYGNTDNLSSIVLDFYYQLSAKVWLKDYIQDIQKNYSFDVVTENYSIDNKRELYLIILKDYYTYSFFVSVVKQYIHEYSSKWNEIYSYFDSIKKYLHDSLIEKIKKK
jgi:hypothetical protein